MRLFIIRHADPDYPNNTITAAGHLEAKALSVRMARLGLDKIFVSPLGRARDTCRYTADLLGIEPVVLGWTQELPMPRIEQEVLGESTVWDVHGHTLRALPAEVTSENWHTFEPFGHPEVRSQFEDLIVHSDVFLRELGFERQGRSYRVLRPDNRDKVAVFCHGGFGLTWLAHLLDIPLPRLWGGFFLPPSSVTTVLLDERVPGIATPRALGVGDISHLYAAGLPMQAAGIKANVE